MNSELKMLLILLVSAGIYIGGYTAGGNHKQAQWDASKLAEQKTRDETAQIIASRLADMASTQAKTVERVTHEVQTNTVYRDCVVPDNGLRMLNDAISGTSEPAGSDGVQTPASAP